MQRKVTWKKGWVRGGVVLQRSDCGLATFRVSRWSRNRIAGRYGRRYELHRELCSLPRGLESGAVLQTGVHMRGSSIDRVVVVVEMVLKVL